jgi:hypothetical protein
MRGTAGCTHQGCSKDNGTLQDVRSFGITFSSWMYVSESKFPFGCGLGGERGPVRLDKATIGFDCKFVRAV